MKIEFYHIDAMEAAHYVPLWRALREAGADARLVAVPGRRNTASRGWFDFSRLQRYYDELGVPYKTTPDYTSHAITTQNAEILRSYRGIHLRLMYGPVIYPEAWGLSERAARPFGGILVHGQAYERLFSRWKSSEDLVIVGYPRFDEFFAGTIDISQFHDIWHLRSDRKTLLYLPTWGENSSLDNYLDTISSLTTRFNILLKPHHCSLRFEPERMARIRRAGVMMPDSAFDLPALFACADLVISDVRSAAFCEAMTLGRPVLGLVTNQLDLEQWLAAENIGELAEICSSPSEVTEMIDSTLSVDRFATSREIWAGQHLEWRNGQSARKAAIRIIEYLEQKEIELNRSSRGLVQNLRRFAGKLDGNMPTSPDTFVPYRPDYFNAFNRKLVEAAKTRDYVFLVKHLVDQDSRFYEDFIDEKIEVRTGLKIIFDEINRNKQICTILDIACGNCSLLKKLAEQGYHVIGVDASPIRVIKNRKKVRDLYFGVAEDLPIANETVDVVVATEALEHVYDAELAVSEIARVLKPGGKVYCQVPEFDFADGENHLRHFSQESLSRLFRSHFTVDSIRLIPYLDGERPRNIFLIATKTGDTNGLV